MSKLKRKSICQRHVKGELPGTRRTVSHVDDDSVVNNHSEGYAAARASTTGDQMPTGTKNGWPCHCHSVRCVVGLGGGGGSSSSFPNYSQPSILIGLFPP